MKLFLPALTNQKQHTFWTDITSVSLALDDRSLLFGATGASHVHGKPNILGISRVYRCVLSASRSNNESCRIGNSDTVSQLGCYSSTVGIVS